MKPDIIYTTGQTSEGTLLKGGIWKLWEQEGFPLELSHLFCQDQGWKVDWLEAMADASSSNNLPSLIDHLESFLPPEVLTHLKSSYGHMLNSNWTPAKILESKQP